MNLNKIKNKSRVKIPMVYDYHGKRNQYVYIEVEEDYMVETIVTIITDYGEIVSMFITGNTLCVVLRDLIDGVYA